MSYSEGNSIEISVIILGKVKILRSTDHETISNAKVLLGLAPGARLYLYYSNTNMWDIKKIEHNTMIDKPFREE